VLDDFNTLSSTWWPPSGSGSTAGVDTDVSRANRDTGVLSSVESTGSVRMDYRWQETHASPLLRWHNTAVSPKFSKDNVIQYYLFGDGSKTSVAVVLRNGGEGDMWRHQLITLDWVGWRLITWDMAKDPTANFLVGSSGTLPSGNVLNLSCFAFYPAPVGERVFELASIYFSRLQVVQLGDYISGTGMKEISTEKATVSGYYDLLGRKFTKEPTNGIYIILYDNGKAVKAVK